MSKGKLWRAERHIKETMRRLDYVQRKQVLRELVTWSNDMARPAIKGAKPERMRLSVAERIRFKYWLLWKYGPECAYCHKFYDWRHALTIDHIQPKSKGGAVRDVRNMVLACRACNETKGDDWLY